ncbi:UDP-glycosyltransferase 86A1-like [Primulina eburnea]|uniref:UDP-glycosyltransferase 86A1-like n=1 Tax=Primulina eburnea TaxID=1245227 RepID=UPI003C6C1CED
MASSRKEKQPHAIMISMHLQGHIIPYINLALKLASNGFAVTFAHLEFIHHHITTCDQDQTKGIDIFSEARRSGLDINYATISDGFPVDFDRSNNLDQFLESYINDFPSRVDEFLGEIMRTHLSWDYEYFLVADTFSFWAPEIAEKYEMVSVSFWTEPAIVFSLYYHLQLLKENGHVPVNGRQEEVDYVPGIRAINTKDFMSYLQESELTLLHRAIFGAFDDVKRLDFILCNTVEELEAEAVSVLQKKQPFYAIGPLFPLDLLKVLVPRSLLPELDCTEWLNTKAPGSVLYVSFGSLATTEKNVILEIAGGILLSGVNFIWVLRPGIVGSDEDGMLPDGFQDRVKDQGVIVPWCKQWQVLSNPGIGGFLTHCGWNSVLESIWFGVPMICYPLFTDQITNRKLVVDDWKVGLNLCNGKNITREEVVEKIGTLMDEEKSFKLRQEIKKLRNTLQNASSEDGSSERNFARFVKDLRYKVLTKSESLRS